MFQLLAEQSRRQSERRPETCRHLQENIALVPRPSTSLLIGGFGAGGEISACLALGYDCVAFEQDKAQYDAVATHLHNLVDTMLENQDWSTELALDHPPDTKPPA